MLGTEEMKELLQKQMSQFSSSFYDLRNPDILDCFQAGTSAGSMREAAQEGISFVVTGTAQGTLEVNMALGILEVGMAQDILRLWSQEVAGRAACTGAVYRTFLGSPNLKEIVW